MIRLGGASALLPPTRSDAPARVARVPPTSAPDRQGRTPRSPEPREPGNFARSRQRTESCGLARTVARARNRSCRRRRAISLAPEVTGPFQMPGSPLRGFSPGPGPTQAGLVVSPPDPGARSRGLSGIHPHFGAPRRGFSLFRPHLGIHDLGRGVSSPTQRHATVACRSRSLIRMYGSSRSSGSSRGPRFLQGRFEEIQPGPRGMAPPLDCGQLGPGPGRRRCAGSNSGLRATPPCWMLFHPGRIQPGSASTSVKVRCGRGRTGSRAGNDAATEVGEVERNIGPGSVPSGRAGRMRSASAVAPGRPIRSSRAGLLCANRTENPSRGRICFHGTD